LTPTTSFPVDLISSGTVFAISSTLSPAAAVGVPSPESVPLAHPDKASAHVAANTAAIRHNFPRRS